MSGMLTLEEAQERLLALVPDLGAEEVDVEASLGRFLAHDLIANRTQPPSDLSAMDGYAIAGNGPWSLIGESRAGAAFGAALTSGQAIRISTGAHMPDGGESVLIQENAVVSNGTVSAQDTPELGRHVRKQGFDFAVGDTVLGAGTQMGPAQIALALSSGHKCVQTKRIPKVAILDSGDELARDPTQCGPDQIPASNGAMIAAMAGPLVGEVVRLGPVGDDLTALAAALQRSEDADILITSGGASVGDHDLIQQALREWGAQLAFWKVAIKPGKPLMVATKGSQVILGLPGNPVSSFVTAFLFALPLLRAAIGHPAPLPKVSHLQAREALPAIGARREFVRGISDGSGVGRAASQDSSALLALASANCLIDRPAGSGAVSIGDDVPVYIL